MWRRDDQTAEQLAAIDHALAGWIEQGKRLASDVLTHPWQQADQLACVQVERASAREHELLHRLVIYFEEAERVSKAVHRVKLLPDDVLDRAATSTAWTFGIPLLSSGTEPARLIAAPMAQIARGAQLVAIPVVQLYGSVRVWMRLGTN